MTMMVKIMDGKVDWPRRASIPHRIPAENAISEVTNLVESLGCHPRLTDAVVALQSAREAVADWAEETGNVLPGRAK